MQVAVKSLLSRVDRLETAANLPPAHVVTAAARTLLDLEMARVLSLAPTGSDRDEVLHAMLCRLDRGCATDEDRKRIEGVNLDLMRLVSRLESSC